MLYIVLSYVLALSKTPTLISSKVMVCFIQLSVIITPGETQDDMAEVEEIKGCPDKGWSL